MTDDPSERGLPLQHLRSSVRALAHAGSDQPALFPDLIARANELALDFAYRLAVVRESETADLDEHCLASLDAIERQLEIIARDGAEFDVDLWTDAALRDSLPWADVRRLALAALEALDAFVPDSYGKHTGPPPGPDV